MAIEIIPTMQIINKLLVIMAVANAGIEANNWGHSMVAQWPGLNERTLSMNKAAIIATGTKDKKRITGRGTVKFLTKINGITLDNQVTKPQPRMVNRV